MLDSSGQLMIVSLESCGIRVKHNIFAINKNFSHILYLSRILSLSCFS